MKAVLYLISHYMMEPNLDPTDFVSICYRNYVQIFVYVYSLPTNQLSLLWSNQTSHQNQATLIFLKSSFIAMVKY